MMGYYETHKEQMKDYSKNYHRTHRKQKREYGRKYYREHYSKLREQIVELLGDKCIRCGFSDIRALQIDHVNGNGKSERKCHSLGSYYKYILEKIKSGSKDYQLLCANCNWIKRAEKKEWGKI